MDARQRISDLALDSARAAVASLEERLAGKRDAMDGLREKVCSFPSPNTLNVLQ